MKTLIFFSFLIVMLNIVGFKPTNTKDDLVVRQYVKEVCKKIEANNINIYRLSDDLLTSPENKINHILKLIHGYEMSNRELINSMAVNIQNSSYEKILGSLCI